MFICEELIYSFIERYLQVSQKARNQSKNKKNIYNNTYREKNIITYTGLGTTYDVICVELCRVLHKQITDQSYIFLNGTFCISLHY